MHPAIYRLIIGAKQVPLHVNQHLNRRVHVSFGAVMLAGTLALNVAAQQQTSPIPDAQVELNVLRALTSSPELASQNIQSATVNGVVTLTGSANDEASRTKAEDLVARALGVKKVVDGLTVGHRTLTVTQAQDALTQAKAQAKQDQKSLPNCRPLSGPDLSQCNHAWAAQLSASNKRVADAQKAVYEAQASATRQEQARQRAQYEASHPKASQLAAKPALPHQEKTAKSEAAIGSPNPRAPTHLNFDDAPPDLGFHYGGEVKKGMTYVEDLCAATMMFASYNTSEVLQRKLYSTMALGFYHGIQTSVRYGDLSKDEADKLQAEVDKTAFDQMLDRPQLAQQRIPYCRSLYSDLGLDDWKP